jgi:hypothetical protein
MFFCRENEQLSKYGDTKSARSIMLIELKKLIEANPLFREKLVFPTLKASRLRTLINQRSGINNLIELHYMSFCLIFHYSLCECASWWFLENICSLNWQHQLCKNPRPNPDIKTLFTDHTCSPPNGARTSPVSVPLAAVPKAGAAYPPLVGHPVCFYK